MDELLRRLVNSVSQPGQPANAGPQPNKPAALTLPHPEETPNNSATVASVNLQAVRQKWLTDWSVPQTYWDFWNSITIEVKADSQWIAATWSDRMLMWVQPAWCNPGVLAHEMGHVAYWLLPKPDAQLFNSSWKQYQNDPYLNLLVTQRPNTGVNDVEAHAEIYRFLGTNMPAELKRFYRYLF